MRLPRSWRVIGAIYVAFVLVLATIGTGDGYNYNAYLLLIGLTVPLSLFVMSGMWMLTVVLVVVFNVPLTGSGSSRFDGAMFVVQVLAYGAAATFNVVMAHQLWIRARPCLARVRLQHTRG